MHKEFSLSYYPPPLSLSHWLRMHNAANSLDELGAKNGYTIVILLHQTIGWLEMLWLCVKSGYIIDSEFIWSMICSERLSESNVLNDRKCLLSPKVFKFHGRFGFHWLCHAFYQIEVSLLWYLCWLPSPLLPPISTIFYATINWNRTLSGIRLFCNHYWLIPNSKMYVDIFRAPNPAVHLSLCVCMCVQGISRAHSFSFPLW